MKGRLAGGARRRGATRGNVAHSSSRREGTDSSMQTNAVSSRWFRASGALECCPYGKAIGRNHDELPNQIRDPKKRRWVSERDGDARRRSVAPRTI